MRKLILQSVLITVVTTALLGFVYPLVVTGAAQLLFHEKANGQLVVRNGNIIGSRILAQPFTSNREFHERPSAAGNGYDATSSGGSNLGPTNKKLMERVAQETVALNRENPVMPVPIDLVTTSASGLDPDITPAAALFQVNRVARARGLKEADVRQLVLAHTEGRQFGLLGEPRVNVLELNLALDALPGAHTTPLR
jgi:potassium-transporting ATPase KdpC subunit